MMVTDTHHLHSPLFSSVSARGFWKLICKKVRLAGFPLFSLYGYMKRNWKHIQNIPKHRSKWILLMKWRTFKIRFTIQWEPLSNVTFGRTSQWQSHLYWHGQSSNKQELSEQQDFPRENFRDRGKFATKVRRTVVLVPIPMKDVFWIYFWQNTLLRSSGDFAVRPNTLDRLDTFQINWTLCRPSTDFFIPSIAPCPIKIFYGWSKSCLYIPDTDRQPAKTFWICKNFPFSIRWWDLLTLDPWTWPLLR